MHADQAGVVARRQLLEAGLAPHDIRGRLRRWELSRVLPGVYADHTGPLTWIQQAWAAVLYAWPAALTHDSAVRVAHGRGLGVVGDVAIHVGIDESRRVTPQPGVVVHRVSDLAGRVWWNLGPPRIRLEDATLDVAACQLREIDVIAVLADAVASRRTTAERLRAALRDRPRLVRRAWIAQVLDDLGTGVHSALEHGFLTKVERPHGLPPARRQVRHVSASSVEYRDVEFGGRVVVELDGRLHHESAHQRDADLDRDLGAAAEGQATVRVGWGQVFERPCLTAVGLGAVLRRAGWNGRLVRCSAGCAVQAP